MLARLIAFALTQRILMLLVVALLAGGGWYAFRNTPIDAFPDVSTTQVKVIVKAPGMTPEEVEARITAPIEVEVLGIPRMSMLRSVAKYALTDITVDFEEGTDIYWARQQVAERLTAIWGDLPAGNFAIDFDGTDLASGTYFARLQGDGFVATQKMQLVK